MKSEISAYIQNFWDRIGMPLEAKNEMLKVVKTVFSSAEYITEGRKL